MPAPIVPGSQTPARRLRASVPPTAAPVVPAKATRRPRAVAPVEVAAPVRRPRKPKTEDLTVLDPAPTVKRHRATKAEMEARRAAEAMGTAPVKLARKRAVEVAVSVPRVPGRKPRVAAPVVAPVVAPVRRPRKQAAPVEGAVHEDRRRNKPGFTVNLVVKSKDKTSKSWSVSGLDYPSFAEAGIASLDALYHRINDPQV